MIEFGTRALSALVGVMTVVAMVLAFSRQPFRRNLATIAVMLPLSLFVRGALGGFNVR